MGCEEKGEAEKMREGGREETGLKGKLQIKTTSGEGHPSTFASLC